MRRIVPFLISPIHKCQCEVVCCTFFSWIVSNQNSGTRGKQTVKSRNGIGNLGPKEDVGATMSPVKNAIDLKYAAGTRRIKLKGAHTVTRVATSGDIIRAGGSCIWGCLTLSLPSLSDAVLIASPGLTGPLQAPCPCSISPLCHLSALAECVGPHGRFSETRSRYLQWVPNQRASSCSCQDATGETHQCMMMRTVHTFSAS